MAVGVDLGANTIKLVELRKGFGKAKLTGIARKRVAHIKGGDYKQAVPKLLRDAMAAHLVGKRAVVGVTGRDVNLQLLVYPASKLTDYGSMIRQEVRSRRGDTPDLYVDCTTLRTPDQYFPKYLAVIGLGKNSYVDERMAAVGATGMKTAEVVPAPFALYAAYINAYPQEGGVVMLLNIGHENIDMALVRGGKLIFARNISQGSKIFDDQIKTLLKVGDEEAEALKIKHGTLIAAEAGDGKSAELLPALRQAAYMFAGVIRSSVEYAKNQLGEKDLTIDKIYLSGGGAKLKGLDGYLGSALKTPVEFLDPFKNVDVNLTTSAGEAEPTSVPTDMAVAVGLSHIGVSASRYRYVSLLPDNLRARKQWLRTVPFMIVSGVLVLLTMIVLSTVAIMRKNEETAELQRIKDQIASIEGNVKKVDALEKEFRSVYAKYDLLSSQTYHSKGVLDVYSRLRTLVSDGVLIRKFELVETGQVKRVVANVPDHGHVTGEVEEEEEEQLKITTAPAWVTLNKALPPDRFAQAFLNLLRERGYGIDDSGQTVKIPLRRGPVSVRKDLNGALLVRAIADALRKQGYILTVSERGDEYTLLLRGVMTIPRSEARLWPARHVDLLVWGEVDEQVREGVDQVLDSMARQLTDAANRIHGEVYREMPHDEKPGWRKFALRVWFE